MKSDFLTNLFFRALQTVSIATMLVRLLLPVAIVAALYLLWRIARNLEKPPKLTEEVKIVRKSLSEMLKENRTRCKMTQEFVAEALGVSRQAVSKWENDLSCPDITLLPQLARLFGVTTDELLGNQSQPETALLPEERRKPIKDMVLRVIVNSHGGDKVRVNLPMSLVQVGIKMGMQMPEVAGSGAAEAMKSIDIEQIMALVEQGVIGKLVEVESAEGDIVEVYVE